MALSADVTKPNNGVEAADEQIPLLLAPNTAGGQATVDHRSDIAKNGVSPPETELSKDGDERMPYGQILLLCYASMVEPISYFAIFPIISDMLHHIGGLPELGIGFWSGIIEALFSIVQMSVMISYGKISDRYGRKPVLVFSLFGISLSTALFGVSSSLWQMILFRSICGVFAGSAVTIRCMLSEITNKQTQARAFSWFMFARNIGLAIGPLLGGGLARPAEYFDSLRGNWFLIEYPYALSMFLTGVFCLTSAISISIFVKETLIKKEGVDETMTAREVLKHPGVKTVIFIYGYVMLVSLMFTAADPVWMYTKIKDGGLSFDAFQIGMLVSLAGLSQAFWMIIPFPPLQRRLGTGTVLRLCGYAWPLSFAAMPASNELLRGGFVPAFWTLFIIATIVGSGVSMAFACVQLCVNDIAPSQNTLGVTNAIALTVTCGIRSFAPILGGAVLQYGLEGGWIHGHLLWVVLVALAMGLSIATRYLPEAAEGRPVKARANGAS